MRPSVDSNVFRLLHFRSCALKIHSKLWKITPGSDYFFAGLKKKIVRSCCPWCWYWYCRGMRWRWNCFTWVHVLSDSLLSTQTKHSLACTSLDCAIIEHAHLWWGAGGEAGRGDSDMYHNVMHGTASGCSCDARDAADRHLTTFNSVMMKMDTLIELRINPAHRLERCNVFY